MKKHVAVLASLILFGCTSPSPKSSHGNIRPQTLNDLKAPARGPASGGNGGAVVSATSLEIYTSADSPPYNFLDNQGRPAGFEIDLFNAIFRRLQKDGHITFNPAWRVVPWSDIATALMQDSHDKNYIIVASTEARKDRTNFWRFSIPYYTAWHAFFSNREMSFQTQAPGFIKDVAANRVNGQKLRIVTWGQSVMWTELTDVYGANPQNISVIDLSDLKNPQGGAVNSPEEAVQLGLADVSYGYTSIVDKALEQKLNNRIRVSDLIPNQAGYAFGDTGAAIPFNNLGHELQPLIAKALVALYHDGTYQKISKKWFGGDAFNKRAVTEIYGYKLKH